MHSHLAPPEWIRRLTPEGIILPPLANWSVGRHLDEMDSAGIERAVTSITSPGLWFDDTEAARTLARACNDYAAELRGEELAPDPVEPAEGDDAPDPATSPRYVSRWRKGTRDTTPANLLRPPLIGRADAWATLTAALAPDGETTPILIETEVGMGSTRLLDDLVAEAAAWDVRVVRVRAEKGVDVAYEGWNHALERLWKREPAAFAHDHRQPDDRVVFGLPMNLGQHDVGFGLGEEAAAGNRRQLGGIAEDENRRAE